MIASFRDNWLERFLRFDESHKRVPSNIEDRLFRKLQLIDDANSEADLKVPPGNRYEKLKGALQGWSCIRVNEQWRLVFIWDGASKEASQIYLNNHSYR